MDSCWEETMASSSSSSSSIGCVSDDSSSDSSVVTCSSNMLGEEDNDDVVSSAGCRSGTLFEFSDLMAQLPIKRGLSKYYNGKSDSFKNLTSVKSVEDIPKIERRPYMTKKTQNRQQKKLYTTPKSSISKKNKRKNYPTRVPVLNSFSGGGRRSELMMTSSTTRDGSTICKRSIPV